MSINDRVLVTNPFVGICHMQVCAVVDATDDEILSVCNRENPSGTTLGWTNVLRDGASETQRPVACASEADRRHFLVGC